MEIIERKLQCFRRETGELLSEWRVQEFMFNKRSTYKIYLPKHSVKAVNEVNIFGLLNKLNTSTKFEYSITDKYEQQKLEL